MQRLDKRLSGTGLYSRREAKDLIRAGRVSAGGAVCRDEGAKVAPGTPVLVDGAPLEAAGPVYLMLHKPAGVVSATEDARERTVLDLLPERYRRLGLFPAGRLDKDTEGLLLLTSDGALAHRLLSPKYHVDKVYYVEVDGALDEADAAAFQAGMTLGDGEVCLPAALEPGTPPSTGLVTLREGKYHQVKRMLAARGKPVTYLKRVRFGPLELDPDLPRGGWRALTDGEISALFRQ